MINKVEIYLKVSTFIGHCGSSESAMCDIQSGIPPVIHKWGKYEPDLSDDLGPHVQRVIGVFPF
jgi:hypothetical protein